MREKYLNGWNKCALKFFMQVKILFGLFCIIIIVIAMNNSIEQFSGWFKTEQSPVPPTIFALVKLSRRVMKNVHNSVDGKVCVESEARN